MAENFRGLQGKRVGPPVGQARKAVVFLHGYGANGNDLMGLAGPMAPHLPDTVFYSPDAPEPCAVNPSGFQWFPIPWIDGSTEEAAQQGLARAVQALNGFLDGLLAREGLKADDLALVGFSQGSMLALHVAPRRNHAVAGVVSFSGRLLGAEMLKQEARVNPPILLVHGDQDEVVPFADLDKAGRALHGAGFETYRYVMENCGHNISPEGVGMALSFLRKVLMGENAG